LGDSFCVAGGGEVILRQMAAAVDFYMVLGFLSSLSIF
jgi:hypothetical protein